VKMVDKKDTWLSYILAIGSSGTLAEQPSIDPEFQGSSPAAVIQP